MAVKIGSQYNSNLARLKNCLLFVRNGGFQEDDEVMEVDSDGRCYYNCCPAKEEKSDRAILISRSDGGVEHYSFHSACIEALLSDERVPFLN